MAEEDGARTCCPPKDDWSFPGSMGSIRASLAVGLLYVEVGVQTCTTQTLPSLPG